MKAKFKNKALLIKMHVNKSNVYQKKYRMCLQNKKLFKNVKNDKESNVGNAIEKVSQNSNNKGGMENQKLTYADIVKGNKGKGKSNQ